MHQNRIAAVRIVFSFVTFLALTTTYLQANSKSPEINGYQIPTQTVVNSGHTGFLTGPNSGDALDIAFAYLYEHAAELSIEARDLDEAFVKDQYLSKHSGISHIYLSQTVGGIEIDRAQIGIHIAADGSVVSVNSSFLQGAWQKIKGTVRQTAIEATSAAALHLGYVVSTEIQVVDTEQGISRRGTVSNGGFARGAIATELAYLAVSEKEIRPIWTVDINEPGAQNHWIMGVDADNGQPLLQRNLVVADRFEGPGDPTRNHLPQAQRDSSKRRGINVYEVFPQPFEYPYDGPRMSLVDPASPTASPFGWHDTNGAPGAEFTITRGNNTHAFLDRDNNDNPDAGADVDGGADLDFSGSLVELDLMEEPSTYSNAAVVNLFYWVNTIHDILYNYGFDEASGNFQVNNYGNGGADNDDVIAYAQKGADAGQFNNAFFGTPSDGGRPEMLMLEWNLTTPNRDGDFSSGIMAHEFGHGVSNRLTGGPSTASCLNNAEQMGEGWSDFFGLVLTAVASDTDVLPRGIGVYALGQPIEGAGIRQRRYTTDLAINEFTYADLPGQSGSHQVGFLWCSIIWEVYWGLVDEYGFNPDVYGDWTTGGNNLAIQLIMDGMKLQPCGPGMVDGRDAILQADVALTGGVNQCIIWRAFAKRGLGAAADQGSADDTTDGTADFNIPVACDTFGVALDEQSICAGGDAVFEIAVGEAWVGAVTFSSSGEPAGTTVVFSPNPIPVPPGMVTMTVSNTGSVPFGDTTITISGTDGVTVELMDVTLHTFDAIPAIPTLGTPGDGAIDVAIQPTLMWSDGSQTDESTLEVATDMAFSNIVFTTMTDSGSAQTASRLASLTTHYWRVKSSNPCGESVFSSVFSFTTLEQPDYFTELFDTNNDMAFMTVSYLPDGSGDFYNSCSEAAASFPTDPTGGVNLVLSDDDSQEVVLVNPVFLYGVSYASLFVGSNGYLTFGQSDTDYTETLADHFDLPRISGVFDDMNPTAGGSVSYRELADRVVVTYDGVAEYNTTNSNSFQIEMFFNGDIIVTYLGIDITDGLSGISDGNGLPVDYVESDLSAGSCSACLGDFNGDMVVDIGDLNMMAGSWGTLNLAHDLNADNTNNLLDMIMVEALFGACAR